MGRKARLKTKSIFGKILCSIVYLVLFMPIAVVVVNSFNATTSKPYLTWKGFTIDWYFKLFENESLLASFGNTMIIALITTLLATAIQIQGQKRDRRTSLYSGRYSGDRHGYFPFDGICKSIRSAWNADTDHCACDLLCAVCDL